MLVELSRLSATTASTHLCTNHFAGILINREEKKKKKIKILSPTRRGARFVISSRPISCEISLIRRLRHSDLFYAHALGRTAYSMPIYSHICSNDETRNGLERYIVRDLQLLYRDTWSIYSRSLLVIYNHFIKVSINKLLNVMMIYK